MASLICAYAAAGPASKPAAKAAAKAGTRKRAKDASADSDSDSASNFEEELDEDTVGQPVAKRARLPQTRAAKATRSKGQGTIAGALARCAMIV